MTTQALPATFVDALETLDTLIPAATKQYLRALDDTDLDREHWGLGLAIRNVLGLWRDDAPLTRWFAARGFVAGDDMAGEVLRAPVELGEPDPSTGVGPRHCSPAFSLPVELCGTLHGA